MAAAPISKLSSTRQAWCINRAGAIDRLALTTESIPLPAAGEARVRVHAIGLNFADVFACLGLYSATPRGPFVPGLEYAGTVDAVGPATPVSAPVAIGDRVMALTRFGGYATALNVDTRYLRPMPATWSFAEAAAFPAQAITAWYGLMWIAALRRDEMVLIHSLAGGVGLHALEIARSAGARIIGTVGAEEKRDWLVRERGLPPATIVVRDRRRFAAQLDVALQSAGADGFDVVFDAVLGPYFRPAYTRLRPEGRYVVYGAADFMPRGTRPNWARLAVEYLRRPKLDPLNMIAENRRVAAFNLIWLWDRVERLAPAFDAVLALERPPHVGARFAFADAPAAIRALQSGKTMGKVILEV